MTAHSGLFFSGKLNGPTAKPIISIPSGLLLQGNSRTESLWQRPRGPLSLRYLLSGSLQKKFASFWSMASILFYFPQSEAELFPKAQSFCFAVMGHLNEAEEALPGSRPESR